MSHFHVEDAQINLDDSKNSTPLPTSGFHSSNGWSVHFSLKKSIENSVIEALERHTLLYTYLHSGWNGFEMDTEVPFQNQVLTPYISKFNFGGFGAGIVATEGNDFPGRTFGYLCDDAKKISGSSKWLSAFFESYGQWESFKLNCNQDQTADLLTQYRRHFLTAPHQVKTSDTIAEKNKNVAKMSTNVLMLDLKQLLGIQFPMFAAFTFGGDLIPLFFRQKLSEVEITSLQQLLKCWNLSTDLPEFHPIL